ncbi:MAG: LuxR C-terminal-related transcriptional regulator [Caldilineaceae bacterium]
MISALRCVGNSLPTQGRAYFQQLTYARILLAQSTHDPQASFFAMTTNLLAPLLVTAEVRWNAHVIEILLQALFARAQGQHTTAQTLLIRALTLAEPAGYIRLFVDEGEPMRSLILDVRFWIAQQPPSERTIRLSLYVDKLITSFGDEQSIENKSLEAGLPKIVKPRAKSQNVIEPLTARELEVLQLVAAGFSNTEIATRLIVTTATVKAHINHIFAKLAVESRIQAVVHARELGLLNG